MAIVECGACGGDGNCPKCGGSGNILYSVRKYENRYNGEGFRWYETNQEYRTCPRCGGDCTCTGCGGSGWVKFSDG